MASLSKIAWIPARGGSKRVPRKNARMLGDKPLFMWSVEHALALGLTPVVDSDDEEILGLVEAAKVPFHERPKELATDNIGVGEAFQYFKTKLVLEGIVVQLYPTTPFRDIRFSKLLLKALETHPNVSTVRKFGHALHPIGYFLGANLALPGSWPLVATVRNPIYLIDIDTADDWELAELVARDYQG